MVTYKYSNHASLSRMIQPIHILKQPHCADQAVVLIHEPTNPHDPHAIAIKLLNGNQLGYVPRDINQLPPFRRPEDFGHIRSSGPASQTDPELHGASVSSQILVASHIPFESQMIIRAVKMKKWWMREVLYSSLEFLIVMSVCIWPSSLSKTGDDLFTLRLSDSIHTATAFCLKMPFESAMCSPNTSLPRFMNKANCCLNWIALAQINLYYQESQSMLHHENFLGPQMRNSSFMHQSPMKQD